MRKILYALGLWLAAMASACGGHSDDEWVVRGTTSQERLNGWQVFIVPCDPSLPMFTSKAFEDSIGVDSVVIENGRFEFRGKGEYLARITIDKHMRYGTQDLLVVTEPGQTVEVVIDSVSHGSGTPQNDALEQWKGMKMAFDAVTGPKIQEVYRLHHAGDTIAEAALRDSLAVYSEDFRLQVLDIANTLGSGTAHDLLIHRYGNK